MSNTAVENEAEKKHLEMTVAELGVMAATVGMTLADVLATLAT